MAKEISIPAEAGRKWKVNDHRGKMVSGHRGPQDAVPCDRLQWKRKAAPATLMVTALEQEEAERGGPGDDHQNGRK